MGQYWEILNADKGVSLGCMGNFSLGGHEAATIVKLISAATKYKSARTGICDLPCELQDAIFAELCEPVDVFAFYLTASHFWRIGLSHYKALYMDYVRHAKDWSGDRLVCIGDGADGLPKGLFTDEDLDILEDSYFDCYGEEPSLDLELTDTFRKLRDVQWPGSYRFTNRCKLTRWNPLARLAERKPKRRITPAVRRRNRSSTPEKLLEEDEPGNDLPLYLPLYKYKFSDWVYLPAASGTRDHARPCILRNLSKRVYVRDDFLTLEKEDANEDVGGEKEKADEEKDAGPYYVSYGSLLVLRIAWSSDLTWRTTHDRELCRGIVAGDRFDIVNIDAIDHEEGWTDVSTEGRELLIQVCKEKFGDRWQAEVREMEM
ncbi:hypothetical protein CPB85DRAFT_1559548 [Mucidula mucida]|nr:hypothetical protein CPB85DRAFT_1559548 [Mucidula mucida]